MSAHFGALDGSGLHRDISAFPGHSHLLLSDTSSIGMFEDGFAAELDSDANI